MTRDYAVEVIYQQNGAGHLKRHVVTAWSPHHALRMVTGLYGDTAGRMVDLWITHREDKVERARGLTRY